MPETVSGAPDGGIELTRPGNVLLAACTVLGIAAGSFALSSCGGGGGGGGGGGSARTSGPFAVITPPGRQYTGVPLTGVNLVLHESKARWARLRVSTEPVGSLWSGIEFHVEPYYAGTACCSQTFTFSDDVMFRVNCRSGYKGEAVARVKVRDLGGNRAEETLAFTCG